MLPAPGSRLFEVGSSTRIYCSAMRLTQPWTFSDQDSLLESLRNAISRILNLVLEPLLCRMEDRLRLSMPACRPTGHKNRCIGAALAHHSWQR